MREIKKGDVGDALIGCEPARAVCASLYLETLQRF